MIKSKHPIKSGNAKVRDIPARTACRWQPLEESPQTIPEYASNAALKRRQSGKRGHVILLEKLLNPGERIPAMGILVALQSYRSHRNRKSSEADGPANFAPARWIGALVLLAGYYLLLDILGMVVTSALALLTFMLLGGERRPVLIVAITVILPVALFLFFRYVANVSIPMGIFGDWIS